MPAHPRRLIFRLLTLMAAIGILAAACGPAAQPTADPTSPPGDPTAPGDPTSPGETQAPSGGEVIMLSTQLAPIEEAEMMRNTILADYPGGFTGENFVTAEAPDFNSRVRAEATSGAGGGEVGVLGGLHGDFAPLAADGLLMDLSDLADELGDRGFIETYTDLAHYGTEQQYFIPWMQATYIMAARQEAMEYLPDGADQNALTWEQVTEWGKNISDAGHGQRLGFPAGDGGLWHRFFQGFGLPSYTGAVNTRFNSPEAAEMWTWLTDTWQYVHPQSLTSYSQMHEPLSAGEVWVAWDHVVRLRPAFAASAEDFVAMPAPAGPRGRAFMPVVIGLAIPNSAPDVEAAKNLIRYLTRPEIAAITLREVGNFPATTAALPADLDPGIQEMVDAVVAMTTAEDALAAMLPVGLGALGGDYNRVFRDTFESIVIGGQDIQTVLDREAPNLQRVLDEAGAACWPPDPPSDGPCQVQ